MDETTTRRPKKNYSFLSLLIGLVIAGGSFAAGATQEKWQGYVATFFGAPRSTETIDLSSVQRTYQYLKANFDGEFTTQELIDGANKGLVAGAGDIHTNYLTKAEAEDFDQESRR